jgi:glycosyltransferase involved in cell wall biosynthesis
MDEFYKELINLRHEVMVNCCDENCDVILCENRNQWEEAREFRALYPNIPLICLNWDWYDFLKENGKFVGNKMFGEQPVYDEFTKLMREGKELWSSTKEWADKCENDTGLKTAFLFYCFILPWEWEGEKKDYGYIMQASREAPSKRFDWYEKAAEELDIPYKSYHPTVNSRRDYVRTVKNCSFAVLASREEGVGVTPIEAAYCHKPILLADSVSFKDTWGDTANYYKIDDFEDFKKQMKWLWENYKSKEVQDRAEKAYQRVCERYLLEPWTKTIVNRLEICLK